MDIDLIVAMLENLSLDNKRKIKESEKEHFVSINTSKQPYNIPPKLYVYTIHTYFCIYSTQIGIPRLYFKYYEYSGLLNTNLHIIVN